MLNEGVKYRPEEPTKASGNDAIMRSEGIDRAQAETRSLLSSQRCFSILSMK